jgi:transposase
MSHINLPLDIKSLEILSQSLDSKGNIVIEVKSKKSETSCHKCGKPATKRYGVAPSIEVSHLPILDTPVTLKIQPVRYQCENCDDHTTTTEQYDWCARGSKITRGLERYLLRCLINSTVQDVARKERISYKTIVSALNRVVECSANWDEYDDLNVIGIDEIATKKGHQSYVTIISTVSRAGNLTVIAVLPDRLKETVLSFLKKIPLRLRKTVKTVCCDMYDGFVNSATEVFGNRAVVIDRFHIAKQYREPLDKMRIAEMKRLKTELSEDEYNRLDGMMWVLRKHHECLSEADKSKLALLYKYSPELKEAHSCALRLTHIFNTHSNRKLSLAKIDRWISSIQSSSMICFNKFIKTLEKYKSGIANYFKHRKNSGFVEGLNNKIKLVKRRCYGFFKTESIFQRLYLDLKGYEMFAK